MRRTWSIGLILPLLLVLARSGSGSPTLSAPPDLARDTLLILANRPTVVAFVGAPKDEVIFSSDWAQVMSGFKVHLESARPRIEQLTVAVREVYASSITFRSRDGEWTMTPGPDFFLVGYYLWAPGGPRYVCRGVMTDVDLTSTVTRYLTQLREPSSDGLSGCERADP